MLFSGTVPENAPDSLVGMAPRCHADKGDAYTTAHIYI